MNIRHPGPVPGFNLEYPMSLGVFDSYQQAQRVVDYLSDNAFEVRNVAIVGRSEVGRTGHRTLDARQGGGRWGELRFLDRAVRRYRFRDLQREKPDRLPDHDSAAGRGLRAHLEPTWVPALTRGGTRDFASVSQLVATKYEVLVEHRFAERARELLERMPST